MSGGFAAPAKVLGPSLGVEPFGNNPRLRWLQAASCRTTLRFGLTISARLPGTETRPSTGSASVDLTLG